MAKKDKAINTIEAIADNSDLVRREFERAVECGHDPKMPMLFLDLTDRLARSYAKQKHGEKLEQKIAGILEGGYRQGEYCLHIEPADHDDIERFCQAHAAIRWLLADLQPDEIAVLGVAFGDAQAQLIKRKKA